MQHFLITSLLVLASFAVRADDRLVSANIADSLPQRIIGYPVITEVDPLVQALTAMIHADSIMATVQHLEDYGTRTYFKPQAYEAEAWLQEKFEAMMGLDVEIQDVGEVINPFHTTPKNSSGNVIAVQKGKIYANEYIVVGGHYDSYTHDPHNPDIAPGTDDNATGTAGVLELARILSQYEFQRPIVYCCFAAEEVGLYGSKAYASRCKEQEMNILGYFNIDMTGYLQPGATQMTISVIRPPVAVPLDDYYTNIANVYFPEVNINHFTNMYGDSDHTSFIKNGYQAIYPFEDNTLWSPYIHTPNDVVGLSVNNPEQCRVFTQVACASIVTLAGLLQETDLPVPAFSAPKTTIVESDLVQFTDLSINAPTAWHWYFEGGTPPESVEQHPKVMYETPGKYDVKLVVANAFGSDSLLRPTYITVMPFPPIADFVADATEIEAGETVTFTNLSQNNPTTFNWFFEGGSPMQTTQENPVIRFAKAGAYSVRLKATNDGGESIELKENYITVMPKVGIIAPPSPPEGGDVRIYPNPTSGELTICDMRYAMCDNRTSDIGQSDIVIFDVLGRTVGATLAVAPDGTHQSHIAHRKSHLIYQMSPPASISSEYKPKTA